MFVYIFIVKVKLFLIWRRGEKVVLVRVNVKI